MGSHDEVSRRLTGLKLCSKTTIPQLLAWEGWVHEDSGEASEAAQQSARGEMMEADEGTAVEVVGSDPLRGAFGATNNCISHTAV